MYLQVCHSYMCLMFLYLAAVTWFGMLVLLLEQMSFKCVSSLQVWTLCLEVWSFQTVPAPFTMKTVGNCCLSPVTDSFTGNIITHTSPVYTVMLVLLKIQSNDHTPCVNFSVHTVYNVLIYNCAFIGPHLQILCNWWSSLWTPTYLTMLLNSSSATASCCLEESASRRRSTMSSSSSAPIRASIDWCWPTLHACTVVWVKHSLQLLRPAFKWITIDLCFLCCAGPCDRAPHAVHFHWRGKAESAGPVQ